MTLRTLLVLATLLCACHFTSVGAECSRSADCADGQACATNYPSGYCYLDCTNGGDCPGGSTCVTLDQRNSYQCFEDCKSSSDCRSGYACKSVGSSGVCLPN